MIYNKNKQKYKDGVKAQILWYVNDADYTTCVFIGLININLSQIVNQTLQTRGKVQTQEIEIELDRGDYRDTSIKLKISSRKSLKISKQDQMQEIQQSSNKKPSTKHENFYMISNEEIDNFEEKYISDDQNDEDDEFFRGYSPAKEYKRAQVNNLFEEKETQNIRNKLILEDYAPSSKNRYGKGQINHDENTSRNVTSSLKTPVRGDEDSVVVTHARQLTHDDSSSNNFDYKSIKMVDLDNIDETKIEPHNETQADRSSTIKQLLTLYNAEMSNKLSYKEAEEFRESARETALLQNDNKRLQDQYRKYK